MKRISAKRRAELADLRDLKQAAMVRDRGCRAWALVPEVDCGGPLDLDHIKSKGRGGLRLSLANVQVLCRAHHEWKGRNPEEANKRGLWPHSWEH